MIFLDNASTTKTYRECADIAVRFMTDEFFNPSAPYDPSVAVSKVLNECRENFLRKMYGNGKIIFTSSGTESDNLALFGAKKPNKSRIIISASEHPAVKNSAAELKQRGYDVVFADVDSHGRVNEDSLKSLLNPETSMVSIMHVNNETGALNDIKRLCEVVKTYNKDIIFHSDGVQAIGKVRVNLNDLGVDMYSVSSHKIHAPRGAGALFLKEGMSLKPVIYGGGQEFNLRSSTENISSIAAFSHALSLAVDNFSENQKRVDNIRKYCIEKLKSDDERYFIITDPEHSSPYILSFALKYIKGEVMLHSLEKYDIYVGTGSACSSKKAEKNKNKYFNLSNEYEKGIIRLSFSEETTENDIDYFINCLNLEYSSLVKYMRG